jgi:transposase
MPAEPVVRHEPVDDVPVIIAWLLAMHVPTLIDALLPRPHGSWQGLSYGQVVVIWLAYMLTQCDHRMSPVEEWVDQRREVLRGSTTWTLSRRDLTDDRLEHVLDLLGDEEARPWEALDRELGQHLVQAYRLPTEMARIDTSSFSVHHAEIGPDGKPYSLLRFGHSKDHRPDLRQFVQALGTLDPAGLPLVSTMLRGNQNDSPVYLPIWRQMVEIIGRSDFLLVGDCKLSSLGNRVQLHLEGGIYLSPLAMTGQWPRILADWVLDPPVAVEDLRLVNPESGQVGAVTHRGFAMTLGTLGQHPTTQARVGWQEQVFVVCNLTRARREVTDLAERLSRAEAALAGLAEQSGADRSRLEQRAAAVLTKEKVADYLEVSVREVVVAQERLVGPGRPGPNRQKQVVEQCHLELGVTRRAAAIERAEKLAGWRLYVTNASSEQMSLAQSVGYYREQWQPERGFHRWKGGELSALPLYLKHEARIRGLMTVLSVGLRVLTLVEFATRRELGRRQEQLAGLYEGNRKRATDRPTTEPASGGLRAFEGITLYRWQIGEQVHYQLSPLTDLHRRILDLMSLPADLYARLVPTAQFADTG